MDHMKNWWSKEIEQFRAAARNHSLILSSHGEERMSERRLSTLEKLILYCKENFVIYHPKIAIFLKIVTLFYSQVISHIEHTDPESCH